MSDHRTLIERARKAQPLHRYKHWGYSVGVPDGEQPTKDGFAFVRPKQLTVLESLVARLADALEEVLQTPTGPQPGGHAGIPTGPGTIAAELTDPATHGKTLDRNEDGTYRTVGRARQRKPKAADLDDRRAV